MSGRRTQHDRAAPARRALLAVGLALLAAGPAGAETIVFADVAALVGSTSATPAISGETRSFVELRPTVLLQLGSPRLVLRAGYLLAGNATLTDDRVTTYSHALELTLAAEPSPRTTAGITATITQGGTAFRLSQGPVDAGPELMAGDLVLVNGNANQFFSWEVTPDVRLGQSLGASWAAPQPALQDGSATVWGDLRLDWSFPSNAIGVAYRIRRSALRPLGYVEPPPQVESFTHAAEAAWSRDLDDRWSGTLTAGVEQVRRLEPAATSTHPTGTAVVRYQAEAIAASLTYLHAALPAIETGTMAESDEVVLRSAFTLAPDPLSVIALSVGLLRSDPPEAQAPRVEVSTRAARLELDLLWTVTSSLRATARWGWARQLGGITPASVSVVLLGLAYHWGSEGHLPPIPGLGARVDGRDGVPFGPQRSGP